MEFSYFLRFEKGLQAIIIFGVLNDDGLKDAEGTYAGGRGFKGPTHLALEEIKAAFPGLLLIVDVCLCAFTSHGHCGLLTTEGYIDNAACKLCIFTFIYA